MRGTPGRETSGMAILRGLGLRAGGAINELGSPAEVGQRDP